MKEQCYILQKFAWYISFKIIINYSVGRKFNVYEYEIMIKRI